MRIPDYHEIAGIQNTIFYRGYNIVNRKTICCFEILFPYLRVFPQNSRRHFSLTRNMQDTSV
jgi:hypothetical protein